MFIEKPKLEEGEKSELNGDSVEKTKKSEGAESADRRLSHSRC